MTNLHSHNMVRDWQNMEIKIKITLTNSHSHNMVQVSVNVTHAILFLLALFSSHQSSLIFPLINHLHSFFGYCISLAEWELQIYSLSSSSSNNLRSLLSLAKWKDVTRVERSFVLFARQDVLYRLLCFIFSLSLDCSSIASDVFSPDQSCTLFLLFPN